MAVRGFQSVRGNRRGVNAMRRQPRPRALVSQAYTADVTRSATGSTTSPVEGYCTAWVWAAGNTANVAQGSGAAMKSFPVTRGQALSWSIDAAGNIVFAGGDADFGATVGSFDAAGAGYGGDDNRSGGPVTTANVPNDQSGAGPNFNDTYLNLPSIGPGSPQALWRGGVGGLNRSAAGGGGGPGQTPGGGGGQTDATQHAGGNGRVILVFSGVP